MDWDFGVMFKNSSSSPRAGKLSHVILKKSYRFTLFIWIYDLFWVNVCKRFEVQVEENCVGWKSKTPLTPPFSLMTLQRRPFLPTGRDGSLSFPQALFVSTLEVGKRLWQLLTPWPGWSLNSPLGPCLYWWDRKIFYGFCLNVFCLIELPLSWPIDKRE